MKKFEIPLVSRCFFAYEHFNHSKKNILLCCCDEESTISAYRQLLFFAGENSDTAKILHFPSLDTVPYDRVSPSGTILSKRADVLTKLASSDAPKLIVTAACNLLGKLPLPSTFTNSTISLSAGVKIDIANLANFLVNNGYSRSASAVDSGEFAIRGEIVDLVTYDNFGYRINFGWNSIETIKEFDTYSQISKGSLEQLTLTSASETLLNAETITNFKNNFLKLFSVNHIKSPIYESIISGQKFHGYEHLIPLFYEEMCLIHDYLGDHTVIYDNLCIQAILEYEHTYNDFYQARQLSNKANPESFYFAIAPEKLINSSASAKEILTGDNHILLEAGTNQNLASSPSFPCDAQESIRTIRVAMDSCASQGNDEEGGYTRSLLEAGSGQNLTQLPDIIALARIEKKTEFDKLFEIITENKKKIPIILCSSYSGRERIKNIAADYEYITKEITKLSSAKQNFINLAIAPLTHGFSSAKYLFIAEQDIFGDKFSTQSHKTSKKKLQNILTELDNISEGELVVHKEHGIGMFEQIQTLYVDNIAHDCLKIIYANNDILYLPVENIDQIKKYGSNEAILDKLGGVNWQRRKSALKNRIKDIALELIKVTAERHLAKSKPVEFDPVTYQEFCRRFIYNETDDQISAINDIKEDLESGQLMDRLICGDVGFGKTEVAMRAAFMAAYDVNDDTPQVAIISPTTILCRQHYTTFLERFKDMGLKIAQLSRLVNSTESARIKHEIAQGNLNIIIGTHALLASNIKFKNLKLLIIDEEQHFGVTQKEHLKQLKTGVHVLSLSATPIPRTLQMSLVGIKDLSLIATPPIDRLPVRTNVMPFDSVVIRDALMRERFRSGLSFYVVPRIKDIEWVEKQLKQFVPELKYKIAHGQMPASEIDKVMNEFCDGKFDILLSTTIIESGIDIPIANTIIIHRSDMLGLSQLYQLRGRVGRGKVRGYAYLTLAHYKKTTKHSLQRLEILQNIDSLGAGFTIAGHDMDLRGFGNLVGSEQSGHIKEVGAELYQEMLDEAINELKTNQTSEKTTNFTPVINLSIPILIPFNYIEDSALRLAIYRRAGDLQNYTEIENFREEMIDRFGVLPNEFNNLLDMVKIKKTCLDLKIESLDSGPHGFVMKFNENFNVADMVLKFVKKYPRHAKIKPDNKLIFIKTLQTDTLLQEAENLLEELKGFNA